MSKFGSVDEKGRPLLLETDTHGAVIKTLKKLERLGYIENYQESFKKKSRLILPKLAFANTDLKEKADIYRIQFQRTGKPINMEDEELRRMFPGVFGKRGIINSQGYKIEKGENGELVINYGKKRKSRTSQEIATQEKENQEIQREPSLRERVNAGITLEEQREFVQKVIEGNGQEDDAPPKDMEKE